MLSKANVIYYVSERKTLFKIIAKIFIRISSKFIAFVCVSCFSQIPGPGAFDVCASGIFCLLRGASGRFIATTCPRRGRTSRAVEYD